MAEKFMADCRYNDFRGRIAIDEAGCSADQNHLLQEMAVKANIPQGYSPVGFRLNGPQIDKNLKPTCELSITLVAIHDEEIDGCLEQIKKYGCTHGRIPLYRFRAYPKTFNSMLWKKLKRNNYRHFCPHPDPLPEGEGTSGIGS